MLFHLHSSFFQTQFGSHNCIFDSFLIFESLKLSLFNITVRDKRLSSQVISNLINNQTF